MKYFILTHFPDGVHRKRDEKLSYLSDELICVIITLVSESLETCSKLRADANEQVRHS